MDGEFKFQRAARKETARVGRVRVRVIGWTLLAAAVLAASLAGERVKDWYYGRMLEGRWIGEEEDPSGLWTREVEYRFHADGRVESTLRFLPQGATAPEVTASTLDWKIRSGHMIFTSPATGEISTRIQGVRGDRLVFAGQAKIREFRRLED